MIRLNKLLGWIIFTSFQVAIIFIYNHFGRDNDEYERLFEYSDVSYFEPIWMAYAWGVGYAGFDKYLSPTYGMLLLLIIAASYFFKLVAKDCGHAPAIILIATAIFAYEVSLVTGALRQGISFLFFSIYLASPAVRYLVLAVCTHLSGTFYLIFIRYSWSLALLIGAVLIVYILTQNTISLDFLESALIRFEAYASSAESLGLGAIILFSIQKVLIFYLFVINIQSLKNQAKSKIILYFIIFSPLMQLCVYIVMPVPVITDRVNLILDPFLLLGIIYVIKSSRMLSFSIAGAIIYGKLIARLYMAVL